MPQLDLTALSAPELRSLLNSARDRGQAQQSYAILQEMQRRREAEALEGRPERRARGAATPVMIDLDLGDPLEAKLEPWEEDDGFVQPQAPADPDPDAEPPLTLARDPEPARASRGPKPPKPPKAAKPPKVIVRRGPGSALGFALGGLAGIALGVGVGGSLREMLFPPAAIETAEAESLPPPPPPSPEPAVLAEAETAPVPTTTPVESQPLEAASPDAADLVQDAAATTPASEPEPPKPELGKADVVRPDATGACAGEATPADRAICVDPELQRLQKALRTAYAEALSAHADKDVLRQRQLAWREARNAVADPGKLSQLYETRIRRLNAATADARRQH